jgi:peptidoglycan/LPS O-acetylase OafA/YrhL
MWSIAVECDIYLLFPLLLVPLARRFGFTAMVCAGFALGFLPTLVGALHHEWESYRFAQTCFWYIGLFALGYAAANLSIDQRPAARRRLRTWHWGPLALLFALMALVSVVFAKPFDNSHGTRWLTDLFTGLAIVCQFTANTQARERGGVTWFERFFLFRPLLFLGTFSYSFYLVQLPIIDLIVSRTAAGWSDARLITVAASSVAAALLVAYVFFLAFERPFMTVYRRRGDAQSLRVHAVREIVTAPSAN